MIERTVVVSTAAVPTADGMMETFVAHPDGRGPFPVVLIYMDMWGMRDCLRGIARRVAAAGYYCAMPDLYYRNGRVRYAGQERAGPLSFGMLDPERQVALRAAMDGLADEDVMRDTAALFHFIDGGEPARSGARSGPIGVIGFCMGGRHAFCAAGRFASRVKAAACLHGAYLIKPGPDSPHQLAFEAEGEIYCGHAERDQYAPADVVERLDGHFSGARVRYHYALHRGAQHAYAIPDRDAYDEKAAGRDWQEILAMFKRQLP
jgi:carboxymethylenebutenolidase